MIVYLSSLAERSEQLEAFKGEVGRALADFPLDKRRLGSLAFDALCGEAAYETCGPKSTQVATYQKLYWDIEMTLLDLHYREREQSDRQSAGQQGSVLV